jgi:neutral amino acid transport system permease protein
MRNARRHPVATLVAAAWVLGFLVMVADTAGAQEDDQPGEAIRGQLRVDDQPVAGATIVVVGADGAEVGSTTSAEDGTWLVPLPAPGTYAVTLDPATLPEGLNLRDPSRATLELPVSPGQDRVALFAIVRGAPPTTIADDVDEGGSTGSNGSTDGEGTGSPERTERDSPSTLDRTAQAVVNGIKFGLIIAMCAIGLSLIFGTTGLINFAHGELVTFGAVVAWYLNTGPGLHLFPAALIAIGLTALVGGTLELGMWRPLRARKTGLFQMLVITIGLSLFARHVILLFFGGQSKPYIDYRLQEAWTFGPIIITPRDVTVMVLSVLTLLGVALLLQFSRLGKATRAVADNIDLAESSGIDVQRIIVVIWMVGAGLAATGGIFLGSVTSVNWLMGFQLLLLMFAAIILGGLGSAYGAMVGGLVVGLVTEVSTVWLSSELRTAAALVVLITVLLFRPEGILGVKQRIG